MEEGNQKRGPGSKGGRNNSDLEGSTRNDDVGLFPALLAGGIAGMAVDAILFPVDTMKTRLQSKNGFRAAGGFRNLYSGLFAAMLGSAPNAALFFGVYEMSKICLGERGYGDLTSQMLAGSMGAVTSCLARVPADNIKQKVQAGLYQHTLAAITGISRTQGWRGYFVGFQSTVLREMPFSVVQFTVWEELKRRLQIYYSSSSSSSTSSSSSSHRLSPWESGLCGSLAGALSAAITTPIDVLKTRQMIGDAPRDASTLRAFASILKKEGITGLFAGFVPRIQLCFVGGMIFFSAYDFSLSLVEKAFVMGEKKTSVLQQHSSTTKLNHTTSNSAAVVDLYASRGGAEGGILKRGGKDQKNEKRMYSNDNSTSSSALSSSSSSSSSSSCSKMKHTTIVEALFAGGVAGICVDTMLFPLDTIKTRLQSSKGFSAAGGFQGVYRGLCAAVIGSAPVASLFFGAYETTKYLLDAEEGGSQYGATAHMISGMVGETVACVMVVPTENVKQKVQAGLHMSAYSSLRAIIKTEGPWGLYRGYLTTVFREVPYSAIQYPIWEALKHQLVIKHKGCAPSSWESGLCGAAAGAIAATVTTPLDVVKTRLMLCSTDRKGVRYNGTFATMKKIAQEDGVAVLFSGMIPRVQFNVLGGLIFFSAYERALRFFREHVNTRSSRE